MISQPKMVAFESMEWHGLWDDAMIRKWRLLKSEVDNKGKKIKHVLTSQIMDCEGFEPRSHFISRLSKLIRVNVVLNRTAAAVVSCITSVDGIKN